jgi:hypothetical protein
VTTRATFAGAAVSALVLAGCRCSEDRPYTPFHIGPKPSSSATPSAAPVASGSASTVPPTALEAAAAPKGVSTWTLDGIALAVTEDRVIDRALAADFDGDGQKEALMWTRARSDPPESAASGELVHVGGRSPPPGRTIAKMPSFVPSGPGCRHGVVLSLTGPHTATLDVAARCDAQLVPRSPTRGIVVLSPAGDRTTVLELRAADPAPAELWSLSVDSSDRDGDGRDDVRVSIALTAEGDDAEARADLVFLDRTAGPSRDMTEPARTLGTATTTAGKNTTRQISARAANARRLYGTLCAESGTARVFDGEGAPFSCPGITGALSTVLVAEVHAAIIRRDAPAAFAAIARDGWYEASLPAKQRTALEKELATAWPKRGATERLLEPLPRGKSGLPRWSPLTFEPAGALLVETRDGVSRVHPDGRIEDATEGVEAWPLAVGAGAAPRWTGVAFPCERSEVLLLESDPTGTPLPSKPTRLPAPRPGPCRHTASLPTPSLTPIEWSETRQAGMIGGALFGAAELSELGVAAVRGSPRSPDGKVLVIPAAAGLVVATGAKSEVWTAADAATLSDCAVANGATAVACVRADRAVLFTPEPTPAKTPATKKK